MTNDTPGTSQAAPSEQVPADPLDAWEALALVEETLPSGMRVRLELPSATDVIVKGLLPVDLLREVMQAEQDGVAPQDVMTRDVELAMRLFSQIATVAAATIRQVWHDEAWQVVAVSADRFARFPMADRERLQNLALREMGIGEVGIRDLVPFRDESGGDDGGADSGEVQPAAGDIAGPAGPGNRASRRRRARVPAQPR